MRESLKQHVDNALCDLSWRGEDTQSVLRIIKGEERVKKRLTFSMAMALLLVIAMAAFTVAEIIRYSVKDYMNLPGETLDNHITTIDEELKTEHMSLYLTDAVFDGRMLSVAFEATPVSGEQVFVVPVLSANTEGEELAHEISGTWGMDWRGFWVPDLGDVNKRGNYGFDTSLMEGTQSEVNWELSFVELKPLWPLVKDESRYSDDATDSNSYDAWEASFETAYKNKQIMLVQGNSLMMFENLLPSGINLAERLIASGAFKKTNERKTSWISKAVQQSVAIQQKVIQGDGFTVTLEDLTLTFMQGSYRFVYTVTDPDVGPTLWNGKNSVSDFKVSGDGLSIEYVGSSGGLVDENPNVNSMIFTGDFSYHGELPEELVFTPHTEMGNQIVPLEKGAFVVSLK